MKTKRIITVVCLVLSLIIAGTAALAYFSDRVTSEVDKRISGTVSLTQTASSISLLNNDGQDILDPGDMRSLQFKIENTGNKSADVKTVIKIKSDKAMKSSGQAELEIYMRNDVEEIPGWGWKPKDGASPISVREMASDGKSITYSIPEYIVSGNEEYGDSNREIEGSAPDEHDYPYVLLVNKDIKNAFGNTGISISIVTEAKQHRNTGPADWTTLRKDVITLTGDETSVVPRVKVKTYHITYDLGGGTLSSENPTEFSADTGLITLNNPTKEGYTFRGWTWNGQDTPVKHLSFEGADYKKDLHFMANYGMYNVYDPTLWPAEAGLSSATKVIFGDTEDYPDVVSNSTPVHVGITNNDEVYVYTVGTTKYVLADEAINLVPYNGGTYFDLTFSVPTLIVDNVVVPIGKVLRFQCEFVTSLTIKNLDTSNITNMDSMFSGCKGLSSLDLRGFDVSNVANMQYMFSNCTNLTTLNVKGWNTGNLTNAANMFKDCSKLTTIIGLEAWDTRKITTMNDMFRGCSSLTSLDLSGWNVASLKNTSCMFISDDKLTTIYVGDGWSNTSINNHSGMFSSCTSIVGGAGTTFTYSYTNKAYARVDDPTNGKPGYFTYKAAP